jgi:membrane fusion protein, copper/silver efflux system
MKPLNTKAILAVLALALASAAAMAVVTQLRHTHGAAAGSVPVIEDGWVCPMHPGVHSGREGSCPICGMKLVNRTASPSESHAEQFHVDPQVQARLGVVVETVAPVEFRPALDLVAQVVADERRTVTLSPRTEGWVVRLGVSVPGQLIHAGQMLYEINSPELQRREKDYVDLLARRELLLSDRGREAQDDAEEARSAKSARDLMLANVAQTRSRLLAADVPAAVIDDLEKTHRIHDTIPVLAEHGGVVTGIIAHEGAYVRPGETVVSYADRYAAWAELQINPELLARLGHGDEVELRSTVNHEASASTPTDSLVAVVDPVSRTARLRAPLPAAGESFLPGTLLDARLKMRARRALTIPNDSVLRTGHGDFVILAEGANHFRQASVRLGAESADRIEVLEGLRPGDEVVTNGQFMLSAESSFQSSMHRMAADHEPPAR